MSTVLPPAAPTLTLPNGGAPVVVTATGDARALAALQAGASLEVVALARPSRGMLEVMTDQGPLQLKVQPPGTLPPIPEGARLTLQVGGNGAVMVTAVNGRPLGGPPVIGGVGNPALPGLPQPGVAGAAVGPGVSGPSVAAMPLPGAGGAVPPAAPAANPAPFGLTATVIRPAVTPVQGGAPPPSLPSPGQPLPANLPAGTQITVRIAGIEIPPPGGMVPSPTAPKPAQGGAPGVGAHPGAGPAPQPGGVPVPSLPAAPSPPSVLPGGAAVPLLAGTVTAHPPGGQAVLSTAIGTVSVPTAETLPAGTVMRLEVVGAPQMPVPTASPPPTRPEGLTAQGWPALSETMETLARSDPQALDTLMRAIPAAGPRLAAAMAAFTGSMKSGDGRGVIGEGVGKALEKAGRRDLAERLRSDLSDLAQDAGRSVGGGEWRLHTLPFSHGAQVDPIRLFVRGSAAEDERHRTGPGGGDQRFILDFHLTHLGRLQLDGLVRREDKLFDLIIRTGEALPQPMRMDIMAIFTQASELVGTKGTVVFQSGGRWLDIRTDETGPTRVEV